MVIGIIEDDELLKKALDATLKKHGYTTVLASSKKEACTFRINGAPFPRQRCKRLRASGALSVCCYLLIGSISLIFLPFISKR